MTSRTLAKKAAEFALSKKASEVLLMDLRKLSAPADFFVLCSADSDTHAKAIADAIRDGTEALGAPLWHSEGYRALSWVLLDYVDVVVHVFKKEARRFYNLDRLWNDAVMIPVEDTLPPPTRSRDASRQRTRKAPARKSKKGRT